MGTSVNTIMEIYDGHEWRVNYSDLFPVPKCYVDWLGCATDAPFKIQNYAVFAFVADVRNMSCVKPIAEPRGLPDDRFSSEGIVGWGGIACQISRYPVEFEKGHSKTFLSAAELLAVDYDATFEDRRSAGGLRDTVAEGEGVTKSLREFLGQSFFNDLDVLRKLDDPDNVRIIFSFES